MRITKLLVLTLLVARAVGQNSTSTTQTDCTLFGNTANCTSTTQTQQQPSAQSEQGYKTGQAVGTALGQAIAYHRAKHAIKRYCKKNPGSPWWYSSPATGRLDGTCPN
jgi:hypothetical protein